MHLQHSLVEVEVLLGRIDRGELETGWDRAVGWDPRRQQLLVDTVLRSWPVPPIVVASEDDREVVLDGRERLRALWRFSRDELPVAGLTSSVGEYLEQLDGLYYSHLPGRFRRRVQRFGVPVVRVSDHADGEVAELLSRWGAPDVLGAGEATVPSSGPPTAPLAVPPARAPVSGSVPVAPPPTVPPPPPPPATHAAPAAPAATPATPAARSAPPVTFEPSTPVEERPAGAHRRPAGGEPIFDELSAWFLDAAERPDAGASAWSSPADPGHAAARSALRNPPVDVTAAGLPRRDPAAHLAPGTIAPAPRARPSPPPDPRAVSASLARFRDGAHAAREDLSPPA